MYKVHKAEAYWQDNKHWVSNPEGYCIKNFPQNAYKVAMNFCNKLNKKLEKAKK